MQMSFSQSRVGECDREHSAAVGLVGGGQVDVIDDDGGDRLFL
jgi:hypothetical protein